MLQLAKTWGHEAAIVVGALWVALGTQGQNGLINYAHAWLLTYPKTAVLVGAASVIVARLRNSPFSKP